MLAVGDSFTDDLQSWVEILRHLLDIRGPRPPVRLVNGGLSAHTSAMVLRRWPAALAARPDWVLCLLGGNDVTRVGTDPGNPRSPWTRRSPTGRAAPHRRRSRRRHPMGLAHPLLVLEDRVAADPGLRYGQSTWRNTDITALGDAIRAFPDPVVHLSSAFTADALPMLLGPDGVHPTLAGQQAIVRTLLHELGRSGR